jgi:fructoselysine 6-phosphate deglycase
VTVQTQTVPLKPLSNVRRPGLDRMLAAGPDIEAFANRVVGHGVRNVFLLGSGGGLITHAPLEYELETRATHFPTFALSANEFIYRRPALLGPGSLALVASNTGRTPEVVAAAQFAREQGATVASFTRIADSPLSQASDAAWTYEDDEGVGDPKQLGLAILGNTLLSASGDLGSDELTARRAVLGQLPDILIEACRQTEAPNHDIAEALADEPIIYVLGSGPNHGAAYCFAMCFLQEMQWKHAASFDAAEFLHGAMEVVTETVPVILFIGEEATRPIDERARAFLDKYTRKAHIIDAADLALTGVKPELRPYVSAFALWAIQARLAEHFAAATGHDLTVRRYMFKVDY